MMALFGVKIDFFLSYNISTRQKLKFKTLQSVSPVIGIIRDILFKFLACTVLGYDIRSGLRCRALF